MYINLLTKLKNAQAVKKESVKINQSKMAEAIAKILEKNNYIGSFEKKVIEIKLKYQDNKGAINGIKLISKPSRRIYFGYRDIKPVKQGYGLLVISTPIGIVTGQEARRAKAGGQALFQIW